MSSLIFKIYTNDEKNNLVFHKDYTFSLNDKIIDIKNIILKNTFHNQFNSIELENITERVYKDFGKLFFDKGMIPQIFDKYKLSDLSNGDRTFSFIAHPKNITESIKKIEHSDSILKKIINNNKKN